MRIACLFAVAFAAATLPPSAGAGPEPAIPRRIVALAPNLTEIVFALQAGDRLVGVSTRSDYPPAARRIPVVGGLTPDLERIVALSPDLVLATTEGNSRRGVEILARRGIPVLTTSAPDLAGVIDSIRRIARRVGSPEAGERLSRALEERRRVVVRRSRRSRPPGIALLVWPSPPQAAGADTFADDVLRTAGARNCVARKGWPIVSPEFLLQAPCDAVVYPAEEDTDAVFADAFRRGPLSAMAAVRAGRVIRIDADLLTRPGPRAFDALERLASEIGKLP